MKRTKGFCRIIAVVTSAVMAFSTLAGCAAESRNVSEHPHDITTTMTSKEIADSITETLRESVETQTEAVKISFDPDDYIGDLDAFVYGMIVNEYESCYCVFNAAIELPDGDMVYGIGYTDYAERYDSDDGKIFFPAGFISLIGEPEISEEDIDAGLEIIDLESEDYEHGFVLAYGTEAFTEHCIIWEQYLQYGVNESGSIYYDSVPDNGEYDENIGSLYSYDESKYLLNYEVGEYVPITGTSLSEQIDYTELEAEINRILAEQDRNFSRAEIENVVSFAPDYLKNALLSMQTETFMGIEVSELIKEADELDTNTLIRITPEGMVAIDLAQDIPKTPSELTKWLTGAVCGVLIIGSIALDIFVPALRPISGAISGLAVEVFVQVVFENHTLDNVNWKKVAVSAASAALLAWACPLASQAAAQRTAGAIGRKTITVLGQEIQTEVLCKIAGYGTLTFCNALVSGVTNSVFSVIDGKDDVFDAFLCGAAIGASSTVVLSALGEVLQKAKLGEKALNAINKKYPDNWLQKATNKTSAFIGKHQVHLKNHELEEILNPCSVYEASKAATEVLPNQPITNKANGLKRENKVFKELKKQHSPKDGYEVLSEQYLRDKTGKIVVDPQSGKARRIDFIVVNKNGTVTDSIEVTSLTADKTAQIAKENRIREIGGNYIKDKKGNLYEISSDLRTTIERVA